MARAVVVAVALWLAITWITGTANVFRGSPSEPPLALLVALLTPPLAFVIAYRGSRRFRSFALSIDLRLLTALQGWRVIGGMFLVLFSFEMLPGLFAYPAGVGDLAVGLAAPFVVRAIARQSPGWQRQVLWLNVAGLVDFVGAIGTGVLTSASALGFFASASPGADMGAFPLSLIPTFAVPLWIVVHVVSLLQLARLRSAAVAAA
ncbi:hypothetical protein [Reyranella sp. CPCC 100927]|uniref:hypothetical protein n=1 Tax=Reyranella sp. CPCC 100927 TaxID=2599616 RepID=UPI0011B8AAA4|nr:hypothetical protein [Reyranella sp. CPCC 100927]TWT03973.1 hypothetical protein FQU96_26645 [Reyranella sp. CPCC 100927]